MNKRKRLILLLLLCIAAAATDGIYLIYKMVSGSRETGQSLTAPQTTAQQVTEQALLNGLHIYMPETAALWYQTLTLTGDALGEQQVYALRELEELRKIALTTQAGYALDLVESDVFTLEGTLAECSGLSLLPFLELCGLEEASKCCVSLRFLDQEGNTLLSTTLTEWQPQQAILTFLADGEPLTEKNTGFSGPVVLAYRDVAGEDHFLPGITKIVLSLSDQEDDYYIRHNRAPYDQDCGIRFTIGIYRPDQPVQETSFSMAELEQLGREYPEHRYGGYYGTIGDRDSQSSMGIDGWLDYFEGLDLWWLLTEQAGLDSAAGYAEWVDRDGEVYAVLEDLHYLQWEGGVSDYYVLTRDGVEIPGSIPILAFSKNGYPLLKEHDHTSSGYLAYNQLNQNLASLGIQTEIGVVKNHNGPFVAGLGNREGYYGGYQTETGGDCIQVNIYLLVEQ